MIYECCKGKFLISEWSQHGDHLYYVLKIVIYLQNVAGVKVELPAPVICIRIVLERTADAV